MKNDRKKITGAEAILLTLIEEGVSIIFGYPGGAMMPIYDKLYAKSHALKHILVRHEQGAAHAAQAYAQVTGKPGVCFATSGRPGPVLIDVTKDAQVQLFDYSYSKIKFVRSYSPNPVLKTNDVNQAIELLNAAKKPLLLAGHGILNKNVKVDLAIHANIKEFFTKIIPQINKVYDKEWRDKFEKLYSIEKEANVFPMIYPGRAVDENVLEQ